jgi:hypothetical protein
MRIRIAGAAMLAALAACGGPAMPTPTTGLTGVVLRGPIAPVCQVNVACDAPFSAGFTVRLGSSTVARFRSDAAGAFTVALQPGTYQVVPDSDAPVISPLLQAKTVTVGSVGLTHVQLEFDTGIR